MNTKSSILLVISIICSSAFSMTLSELNDAIASAESGATVYVTSDIEVTETIEISKKALTLTSSEGECFKLIRTSGLNGNVLKVSGSGCDVTIENLAIDGNIAAGKYSDRLVAVADYAKLSMKEGSSVANGLGYGIELYGESLLNMYDGSAITNFTGAAGQYGIGIIIGNGGRYPPTVNMYGGVVADCHGGRNSGITADWDGAIYLYGGNFKATGGLVTRNTSKQSVAGINAYSGKLLLSGSFTATNNVGGYANDVLLHENRSEFQLDGHYTGSMTLKMNTESQEDGIVARKIWTSKPNIIRYGWENCVSEADPTIGLDARNLNEAWYPAWRKRDIIFSIVGKWASPTLDKAFSEAEAGDTIEIFTDIKCDAARSIPKDLTIRSGGDKVYSLKRMVAGTSVFTVSSVSLTLENIILDGNAIAPTELKSVPMITINQGGTVILGTGSVVSNAVTTSYGAAFMVRGNGAKLIMEDGSLITSCKSTWTTIYGSVVYIVGENTYERPPRFEMRGGAITGNPMENYNSNNTGYGGVVYVQNGVFDMSGGVISDNPVVPEKTFDNMCGGVVNYIGQVRISGSAVIADNGGSHPGLRANANQPVLFYGDFRGRVELQMGSPAEGAVISGVTAEAGATGAWSLNSADGTLVGKVGENGDLVWAKPIGSVNGTRAADIEDLQTILPGSLNLAAGEKLVLGGAAATLGDSLDLDFDPASLLDSGKLPITVLTAAEGDNLSGEWSFGLPEWSGKGGWFVRRSGDAFRLRWEPNGLAIRIR